MKQGDGSGHGTHDGRIMLNGRAIRLTGEKDYVRQKVGHGRQLKGANQAVQRALLQPLEAGVRVGALDGLVQVVAGVRQQLRQDQLGAGKEQPWRL